MRSTERSTERSTGRTVGRSFQRLSVALACAEGDWPHDGWPAPDDPYVERVVRATPPYDTLREGAVDVVVLRCEEPGEAFPALLRALGDRGVPVIVVSACTDTDTVVEVFRGGAGYLVEGDYCPHMLSSAVMAATVGHTYLSPTACAALREGARRLPTAAGAVDRLRSLLSPREREVMDLLSTGLGAQEIGLRLRLSEKTVRNNLSNIYAKLDARGSTDAVLRWLGATPVTPVLRT
ncbi:response regulator transcription factor [Streptomyces sp. ME18-1-4]|uniref:response regulator transcription factor n=1 Tax=Streptomyces sp. ME18-1-4 TaxID=3028685 RepID=UPI0029B9DFFE|nr:response regulator transcription factor [Streptomyces sp. ME18-1-4]MDX3246067.1 response regulator transcription factor [Streptomyces sp. ME18-1-4]